MAVTPLIASPIGAVCHVDCTGDDCTDDDAVTGEEVDGFDNLEVPDDDDDDDEDFCDTLRAI